MIDAYELVGLFLFLCAFFAIILFHKIFDFDFGVFYLRVLKSMIKFKFIALFIIILLVLLSFYSLLIFYFICGVFGGVFAAFFIAKEETEDSFAAFLKEIKDKSERKE